MRSKAITLQNNKGAKKDTQISYLLYVKRKEPCSGGQGRRLTTESHVFKFQGRKMVGMYEKEGYYIEK